MSPEARATLALLAAAEPPAVFDAEAVPVLEGGAPLWSGRLLDRGRLTRRGFSAKAGESLVLEDPGSPLQVLVGLGAAGTLDAEAFRLAGAAAARAASRSPRVVFDLRGLDALEVEDGPWSAPPSIAVAAAAVAEGAALAAYRFDTYRSTPETSGARLEELVVCCDESGAAERGVERAAVVVEAVSLARDLVNTPAADLTPGEFARRAVATGAREGFLVEVLDEDALVREGLGGLLGVARGSAEAPRLVQLVYEPDVDWTGDGERPTLALVGKGITFDSGGLSLKAGGPMMSQKIDMSGGAAVLATVSACRRLGVAVRVLGFVPLTENMPGGRATKPGDVLRTRNGKTIEVLNTDAEGRLILADALALACEAAPDAIVDLATLTGACVVALGSSVAGLMGNDGRLIEALRAASRRSGEAVWPLPLPRQYRALYESEIADMKNIGGEGKAGSLIAGLILEEFVGDVPWAHLDIAGPARAEEDRAYRRKGGTGFGVRTLLELLEHYEPIGGRAAGAPGA